MKVQFRRDKRGEILMSDTFNWDYNPYRVGDMINICGIIYHKYTDGDKDGNDLVKVRDPEWDGIYEVISITHNIHMEQIILTILLLYELKRYNYVKPYNA